MSMAANRLIPDLQWTRLRFSMPHFKQLFSFGIAVQGIFVCHLLFEVLAKGLLGYFGNTAWVGVFEIASKFLLRLRQIFASAIQVTLPFISEKDITAPDEIPGLYARHFPVFILSAMGLFTGLAVGLTKGSSLTGFDASIGMIASGKVLGIPVPFLVFVGVTAVAYLLLNHTTFGFKTRMMGTNPVASNFSGINNKEIIMKDYIFSGIYSSVAGILVMSRTMSASYEYGASTYIMLTLLIYVLAGVVSGAGNVINIFITVLILQVISTGFHMMLVGTRGSSFFKDFIWGLLLIFILIVNHFSQKAKLKE